MNATPFAQPVTLAKPLIDKIDRGIKALEVNYNLKGKLDITMEYGEKGWTFRLANTDESKALVTMTNKSFAGINKFLTECGRVIAKSYGTTETAAKRKTA